MAMYVFFVHTFVLDLLKHNPSIKKLHFHGERVGL